MQIGFLYPTKVNSEMNSFFLSWGNLLHLELEALQQIFRQTFDQLNIFFKTFIECLIYIRHLLYYGNFQTSLSAKCKITLKKGLAECTFKKDHW